MRQLGIIDIRLGHGGADAGAIDAAIVPVGHDLHLHHFLMIGAVVVHHGEQRNVVMRRGPQNSGGIHQIAVILDIHREAAVFPVGERRAHRGGRAVTDAVAAGAADVLIVLVEIPQARWAMR